MEGPDVGMKRVEKLNEEDRVISVTYGCLNKALFKEDAGRAYDVLQHFVVPHQRPEGILK